MNYLGKFLAFFYNNHATKVILMCKLKTAMDTVVLASSLVLQRQPVSDSTRTAWQATTGKQVIKQQRVI